MPLCTGMVEKNALKALRPPAEAPMPTINPPSRFSLGSERGVLTR